MQEIVFQAMHCRMLAMSDNDTPRAAQRLAQVPGWFAEWEQRLSRFRMDSELSLLNRRSGQSVVVSALMQEVLRAALRAARESNGLVSPLVLPALESAGYLRSFEELGTQFNDPLLDANIECAPVQTSLQIHSRRRTVCLSPGARLDLGGIAKGWAADRAVHHLRKLGPALVDAGGDIAVSAPQENGEPWQIGVTNPFDPQSHVDLIALSRGGVATSGRDYRRWQKGGAVQHHIIDPRTGRPAQTDVLTVTVVAPSAQAAEMAAKTVLILGSVQGLNWLEKRSGLAALLVLEDGAILHSRNWMDNVWR